MIDIDKHIGISEHAEADVRQVVFTGVLRASVVIAVDERLADDMRRRIRHEAALRIDEALYGDVRRGLQQISREVFRMHSADCPPRTTVRDLLKLLDFEVTP